MTLSPLTGDFSFSYNSNIDCLLIVRNLKDLTQLLRKTGGNLKNLGGTIGAEVNDFQARMLAPDSPAERSARDFLSKQELNPAMQDIARQKQLGRQSQGPVAKNLDVMFNSPEYDNNGRISNAANLANNGINLDNGRYSIRINPDADEVLVAHELGHVINRQGKLGGLVRSLRDNPELTKALAYAGAAGGLGYAMGNEGNDDIDEAVVLSMLGAAPTLIDEGAASITGLGLMNRAGSRASLGQRGKLAGAYMSYLAPALVTGLGAAGIGNMLD